MYYEIIFSNSEWECYDAHTKTFICASSDRDIAINFAEGMGYTFNGDS